MDVIGCQQALGQLASRHDTCVCVSGYISLKTQEGFSCRRDSATGVLEAWPALELMVDVGDVVTTMMCVLILWTAV